MNMKQTIKILNSEVDAERVAELIRELHAFYLEAMSCDRAVNHAIIPLSGPCNYPAPHAVQDIIQALQHRRTVSMLNIRDAIFMHLRQFFEEIEGAQPLSDENRNDTRRCAPNPPTRRKRRR